MKIYARVREYKETLTTDSIADEQTPPHTGFHTAIKQLQKTDKLLALKLFKSSVHSPMNVTAMYLAPIMCKPSF